MIDLFLSGSAPSSVASKCVAAVDKNVSVFIFGPTLSPTLSRPAGREREPTAIFGRVNKKMKYSRPSTLNSQKNFQICNLNSDSVLDLVSPTVMRKASSARFGGSGARMFERSEFARTPPNLSNAAYRRSRATNPAAFSFRYFSLGKQRKAPRPPGRDPACGREGNKPGKTNRNETKTP